MAVASISNAGWSYSMAPWTMLFQGPVADAANAMPTGWREMFQERINRYPEQPTNTSNDEYGTIGSERSRTGLGRTAVTTCRSAWQYRTTWKAGRLDLHRHRVTCCWRSWANRCSGRAEWNTYPLHMVEALVVGPEDQVVELAPGLGTTAAPCPGLHAALLIPVWTMTPRMVDQLKHAERTRPAIPLGHSRRAHRIAWFFRGQGLWQEAMLTMHADHRNANRPAGPHPEARWFVRHTRTGPGPTRDAATDKATIHHDWPRPSRERKTLTAAEWEGTARAGEFGSAGNMPPPCASWNQTHDRGRRLVAHIAHSWNLVRWTSGTRRILTMRRVFP